MARSIPSDTAASLALTAPSSAASLSSRGASAPWIASARSPSVTLERTWAAGGQGPRRDGAESVVSAGGKEDDLQ